MTPQQLTSMNVIRELMKKHGFGPTKTFGQNFLINPQVVERIAGSGLEGVQRAGVIEIGAGIGTLTAALSVLAERVVSLEIDRRLIPVLQETLADAANVDILSEDALKCDFEALIKEKMADCEDVVVCANLPYLITSPAIMKFLEETPSVSQITVMIQKEVAERICAKAGSRDRGAISVAAEYYCEPEMLFGVSSGCFFPQPKIESAVVRLKRRNPKEVLSPEDKKIFFSLVKAGFAQRRKNAANCFAGVWPGGKEKATEALLKCGFEANVRPETFSCADFKKLTGIYAMYKKACV